MSVVQATDEVLRPRNKFISCLFTDIRNFTNSSNDLDQYLSGSAIPNIKLITSITDKNGGISRVIGDLVLAYYDDFDEEKNVQDSFVSAVSICIENHNFNERVSKETQIDRYVILTSGESIVGNIGSLEHSREITSLGPCVNLTERIDRVTKEKIFQDIVPFNSIVMDPEHAEFVSKHYRTAPIEYIEFKDKNLKVQNFSHITKLAFIDVVKWRTENISELQEVV